MPTKQINELLAQRSKLMNAKEQLTKIAEVFSQRKEQIGTIDVRVIYVNNGVGNMREAPLLTTDEVEALVNQQLEYATQELDRVSRKLDAINELLKQD